MSAPLFLGSEIYRGSSYGAWHPLRVPRVSTVMDLSRALGWLPRDQYITSPRAKPQALHIWHRPDYVAALVKAEQDQQVSDETRRKYHLGTPSNPVYPEVYRRPATAAGASLLAGELLKDGGVIYSPAGGTHHGLPSRANGFCYLNDPVLAILSLKRNGAGRIAYVDIDAHHPDGVEHAFANDRDVLLVSTHEVNRWPRTGGIDDRGLGNVFNLPLPRSASDTDMHAALQELVLPAVTQFRADAIVLQCGADAVEEDPQSGLAMSNNAHFGVVSALMGLAPRLLVLGGGGYNPWSVGRLWTGVWGILNGIEPPVGLPPEGQAVLNALKWDGHRRARNRPVHWETTLRDQPHEAPLHEMTRAGLTTLSARLKAVV
nr:acetoin utilization protein AcuC [Nereida sp. MMG025]